MKRRITVDDLNQLKDEQKHKLREWWKPEQYDRYASESTDGLYYEYGCYLWNPNQDKLKELRLPLLDLGQMIELLDNQDKRHNIYIANNPGTNSWEISRIYNKTGQCINFECDKTELCDALFEVVKQVI